MTHLVLSGGGGWGVGRGGVRGNLEIVAFLDHSHTTKRHIKKYVI